jgi:hypothetical protein
MPPAKQKHCKTLTICFLLPGWVYIASAIACGTGGLLPHRFTLTTSFLTRAKEQSPYSLRPAAVALKLSLTARELSSLFTKMLTAFLCFSATAASAGVWDLFQMPFKKNSVAVCSLLHCPSAFAGHPLDGALSYGSPDFPLENQAIARCTGNIITYERKESYIVYYIILLWSSKKSGNKPLL